MKFHGPLIPGRYIRRYKRFLVDVRLENGQIETIFCPNTGSMTTCEKEGWRVRMSQSDNPLRKLPMTLEMIHNGRCWIGLNTLRTNHIVEEALGLGCLPELRGYDLVKREAVFRPGSRLDFFLYKYFPRSRCYVEVKNVTLVENGVYRFPDAVTTRGLKHLRELTAVVRSGARAVMFYLIQRSDGDYFEPAADIHPEYADALGRAREAGVEVLAYRADVNPREIRLREAVEIRL